jgi:hypothetical protein
MNIFGNKRGETLSVFNEVLCHVDVWDSRYIVPCILIFGTRWEWSTSRPDIYTRVQEPQALGGPLNLPGGG